jgi:hypothetical protein
VELAPTFAYNPDINPAPTPAPAPPVPVPVPGSSLGLLADLVGQWSGEGFNAIWRPNQLSTGQDRFLALNLTTESIEFSAIPGSIPNRGLLQADLTMSGLHYLQQVSDRNAPPPNGLHIEPGVWLNIPSTINPAVSATVARLASVPHGTTLLAQGLASQATGAPAIPTVSLNPFSIGTTNGPAPFPEQNLATTTAFRTQGSDAAGIDQEHVDNPNQFLQDAIAGKTPVTTITLQVSTSDLPVEGGGICSTAFLAGGSGGPNADTALVTATFWLEELAPGAGFTQLQYSQTVLLNFNGLSWPHVSVATLTKQS